MQRYAIVISLVGLVVLATSGCASMGKMPKMPWEDDEPEYKMPIKMVANWKDTVRYNPNDPTIRGFGGRVHFYDETNKPVRVQGQLTVYGYNDSKSGPFDPEKPDRKFVFNADQLQSHYSMSKMGHSYSFWIPWDRVGGEQMDITLAPFFRTASGQVLMSEQSRHELPGTVSNSDSASGKEQMSPGEIVLPQVSQVAYENQTFSGQKPQTWPTANNSKLRTTTISVPKSLESKLRSRALNSQATQQNATGGQAATQTPMSAYQPPLQQPALQRPIPRSPMSRPAAAYSSELLHSRAPESMQFNSGVNLQHYQPNFTNATKYNRYLADGQQQLPGRGQRPPGMPGPGMPGSGMPGSGLPNQVSMMSNPNTFTSAPNTYTTAQQTSATLPTGSLPMKPQVQGLQNGRPTGSQIQSPQSPSLWPPGLR
nr:hypothetical protein [Blastopirellula marina]